MKLTQIANILNTTIVPNLMGQGQTIAEDLSNIIDLGTIIDDMTGDTLKDYASKFALGVWKTWFDDRPYTKHKELGLLMDAQEYGGAVQRVRAGLLKSYDSHIKDLSRDAQTPIDYLDGTYYPIETAVELFTKDVAKKVPYSISTEQIKSYFMSAEGVQRYTALIISTCEKTIDNESYGLQLAVLGKLIVNQYTDGKVVKLFTQYNTEHGYTSADDNYITLTNYKNHPEFFHWCSQVIDRLKSRVGNISKLFNNGEIETFTPESDVKITLLKEFETDNKYANIYAFNKDIVEFGGYNTVDYWQNLGTGLLPSLGVTAEVKESATTSDGDPTTISNVAGVIYDKYACGITLILDKVSNQYVGSEDFTNFYHHYIARYFVDTFANAIVLTLE